MAHTHIRKIKPIQRVYLYQEGMASEIKDPWKDPPKAPSYNAKKQSIPKPKVCDKKEANLVTSHLLGNEIDSQKTTAIERAMQKHAPVLDFDFPIAVYPSSQLGHYHLYIDKPMSWIDYSILLKALKNAGILEPGYVDASLSHGYSAVRPPGVIKEDAPSPAGILKENALLREQLHEKQKEILELKAALDEKENTHKYSSHQVEQESPF